MKAFGSNLSLFATQTQNSLTRKSAGLVTTTTKDTKSLQQLITSEKTVLNSLQTWQHETLKAREALVAWGMAEGSIDLQDVTSRLGELGDFIEQEQDRASKTWDEYRNLIKDIRNRENTLVEQRKKRENLYRQIEKEEKKIATAKAGADVILMRQKLAEYNSDFELVDADTIKMETLLADYKRQGFHRAYKMRLEALRELGRCMQIVSDHSMDVIDQLHLGDTRIGEARQEYLGRDSTRHAVDGARLALSDGPAAGAVYQRPSLPNPVQSAIPGQMFRQDSMDSLGTLPTSTLPLARPSHGRSESIDIISPTERPGHSKNFGVAGTERMPVQASGMPVQAAAPIFQNTKPYGQSSMSPPIEPQGLMGPPGPLSRLGQQQQKSSTFNADPAVAAAAAATATPLFFDHSKRPSQSEQSTETQAEIPQEQPAAAPVTAPSEDNISPSTTTGGPKTSTTGIDDPAMRSTPPTWQNYVNSRVITSQKDVDRFGPSPQPQVQSQGQPQSQMQGQNQMVMQTQNQNQMQTQSHPQSQQQNQTQIQGQTQSQPLQQAPAIYSQDQLVQSATAPSAPVPAAPPKAIPSPLQAGLAPPHTSNTGTPTSPDFLSSYYDHSAPSTPQVSAAQVGPTQSAPPLPTSMLYSQPHSQPHSQPQSQYQPPPPPMPLPESQPQSQAQPAAVKILSRDPSPNVIRRVPPPQWPVDIKPLSVPPDADVTRYQLRDPGHVAKESSTPVTEHATIPLNITKGPADSNAAELHHPATTFDEIVNEPKPQPQSQPQPQPMAQPIAQPMSQPIAQPIYQSANPYNYYASGAASNPAMRDISPAYRPRVGLPASPYARRRQSDDDNNSNVSGVSGMSGASQPYPMYGYSGYGYSQTPPNRFMAKKPIDKSSERPIEDRSDVESTITDTAQSDISYTTQESNNPLPLPPPLTAAASLRRKDSIAAAAALGDKYLSTASDEELEYQQEHEHENEREDASDQESPPFQNRGRARNRHTMFLGNGAGLGDAITNGDLDELDHDKETNRVIDHRVENRPARLASTDREIHGIMMASNRDRSRSVGKAVRFDETPEEIIP